MSYSRLLTLLVLTAMLASVSAEPAGAYTRHHRHHRFYAARGVVTTTPQGPSPNRAAGYFGGYMVTGILGAPSADPYDDPGFSHSSYGLPPIPRSY